MSFLFILPVCLGYLSSLGNNHLSALAALSLTVFVLLLNIEFFNIFWILAAHQMYYLQVFSPSFWLLSLHFFCFLWSEEAFLFQTFPRVYFCFPSPCFMLYLLYMQNTVSTYERKHAVCVFLILAYFSYSDDLQSLLFWHQLTIKPCFIYNLSNPSYPQILQGRRYTYQGRDRKTNSETTMTPQRVDKEIRWTKFMPKYKPRLCVEINYYTQQKWFSW